MKPTAKLSRRWYRGDEIEALADPQWLVDGILPDKSFAILFGEPGCGKSFLALDWAMSVAHGRPWLSRSVGDGDVVYIAAEDAADLKYRRRAWVLTHLRPTTPGITATDMAAEERVAFMPEAWDIVSGYPTLVKDIRALGWKPRLVVVDTLARCFGGDENSAQEVGQFVRGCDIVRKAFPRTALLAVHHTGKDIERGARGSSALKGAADVEMLLTNGARGAKRLTCMKMKAAEPFEPVTFRLAGRVAVGGPRTSCIVAPMGVMVRKGVVDV